MTFVDLIANNFIHSYKTEYLYNLVRYLLPYFMSGPRRFEKSMLVSAIKEIFLGHRDFFTGL
ncbi:MAG: AAA family ATPase [Deltaproteobacteria bacterium]|nr:AAA family ATPase [Deltaproteobacteria bacterium]